ncbi:MAG: YbaB/EbfC family nucleoid-associated protein [Calditerrivibrio sp.]|nr:YbaB/EbfC family nucleoid-associated protein [Calditerrivibrio sp.]MCA1932880.1 YbaB/EbfC family nucleoid-associated protein [Calditerrivibrio sp.]MCA1979958.1 YbaB/EbfC family nucleoid-associated protein [Calditerrivibrio sp.]
MNIQQIMKQAKVMQKKMEDVQAEVAKETVEATSGGGMVKVIFNGRAELIGINIDKDVVNADDVDMLQDLIVAAVNEGIKKAQALMSERMSKLTGGLGLNFPGMF